MARRRGRRMASALALPALLAVGLAACGDDSGDAVSAFAVRSVAQGDTYRFEGLPAEIEGGTITFTLDNADGGESPHEMQILQVDEGTTFEQVQAELLNSEEGAPFPDFVGEIAGGLGTVAPGGQGSVTQELDEGTYLYFCEISDDEESEDAPTHADQGMQGMFTVDGSAPTRTSRTPRARSRSRSTASSSTTSRPATTWSSSRTRATSTTTWWPPRSARGRPSRGPGLLPERGRAPRAAAHRLRAHDQQRRRGPGPGDTHDAQLQRRPVRDGLFHHRPGRQ